MKKIHIFLTSSFLAATLLLSSLSAFSQTDPIIDPGGGLTKGLKGTINGVDTCHCPDDAGNCYCSQ